MRIILIAEDNDEDLIAFQRVMRRSNGPPLVRCRDGEDVLNYLTNPPDGTTHLPSLILLDLNMPGTDGRETLARLKSDPDFRSIPTVVFSTSSSPKDVDYCYDQGANGYMSKPVKYTDLEDILLGFVEYWDKIMILPPPKILSERGPAQ